MKNKKEPNNVLIFAIILIVFTIGYIVIDKILDKEKNEYNDFLKDYKVNEYIPVYISDEDMARIYLNDYAFIMKSDPERAYELLDEEYKTNKFSNYEEFRTHIRTLSYTSYSLDKYYVKGSGVEKIYGVYDKHGNLFVFKTNGVMQYTVYLDDYTVEI